MQVSLNCRIPTFVLAALLFLLPGCPSERGRASREHYFDEKNKLHDGDYFATYPLHSPDSCLIRLRAEVPAPYQPWGCMSIWYRMPRTNRDSSFRLLELYERHYLHDTVHTFAQIKRAEFYVDAAQFQEADSCLRDVERISIRLNRVLDLCDVYFLRGRIDMYRNNFSEARQALFKYLELLDSRDTAFSQERALGYFSIAVSYERAQQHEKSRMWFAKVLNAPGHNIKDPWLNQLKAKAAIANGIGYLNMRPDSSLLWAQRAEAILREALQVPSPPRLSYLFGRAYSEQMDCDKALPYLLDAYRRRPGSQDAFGYYQYPLALGQAYLCIGRLDSAEILLRESLHSPDTGNLAATHRMLGEVAAKRGAYRDAWEYQRTSTDLLRAKFTTDRINAAAETDARYEALAQSKRVEVLEKERQINRLQTTILALCLVFVCIGAFGIYYRQKRLQKILTQKKQLAELQAYIKMQELAHSQKELQQTQEELDEATALLNFKNQLIETLQLRLQQYSPIEDSDPGLADDSKSAFGEMRLLTKEDWKSFLEAFNSQFPDFLERLSARHPTLTTAEIRLILLIKIGFDTRQMAGMLGIADNSLWRSRHRLVKSLGLDSAKNLDGYISAL